MGKASTGRQGCQAANQDKHTLLVVMLCIRSSLSLLDCSKNRQEMQTGWGEVRMEERRGLGAASPLRANTLGQGRCH